jgi:hypothetical protein
VRPGGGGKILIRLALGLAVVAICFVGTTAAVRFWSIPLANEANLIHVVDATYGENCASFVPSEGVNRFRPGNATVAASQTCDNTDVYCPVYVDAFRIGDPAPGCAKDFTVKWRCGSAPALHTAHVDAEAFKNIAWIGCPTQP